MYDGAAERHVALQEKWKLEEEARLHNCLRTWAHGVCFTEKEEK